MRKRVTLSHNGTEYQIVVKEIEKYKRMNAHHAFILRGADPDCYPEEIRDEIEFFSGECGEKQQKNPTSWPVAHITPRSEITVEEWEPTDEEVPEPEPE